MTRVDFYILAEQAAGDRYRLACRLAEKAVSQGRRVYIHTNSVREGEHLDRLLWTFREESFLPHGLSGRVESALNPIIIGHAETPGEEQDVMINLALQVPAFFSLFQRVAEPIDKDPSIRQAGRERYRFYRDRGYTLNNHTIAK